MAARRGVPLILTIALALAGCGPGASTDPGVPVLRPAGLVPRGLPPELLVGLREETGGTWMHTSRAPWHVRYQTLAYGWLDNWGNTPADGRWALDYLRECDTQGFLPAFLYAQLNGEAGGGDPAILDKLQSATTMASYFTAFRTLLERVREFGQPVLVVVEPDSLAFLAWLTRGDPQAPAAIASSGLPELEGLPDTVAGFGLAFLQLRESVGASNVILALHVASWASGKDVAFAPATDPLGPEVERAFTFAAPFGLAPNVTGATYDLLAATPLDRDADYYRLVMQQDRAWDPADTASLRSASFRRYAEWLRLWNVRAGKRWVLFQIPIGNSHHRNVPNDGSPRAGYRDNKAEYFFGSRGDAHRRDWVSRGVIGLFFGAGTHVLSQATNDLDEHGEPYLETRVAEFLESGGLALDAGDR